MNISGIFILFAHWSDYCVDRNDKVFTLLYYIVMHKKLAHPYEIQNLIVNIIIHRSLIYDLLHLIIIIRHSRKLHDSMSEECPVHLRI